MVIFEKPLVRLMKEAYKNKGYTVAQFPGDDAWLCIRCEEWAVMICRSNVPGCVLGLIAEHLNKLPAQGEAYHVRKCEVHTEIVGMVDFPMPEDEEENAVHRTRAMYVGWDIWQMEHNKECIMVDPDASMMIADGGRNPLIVEDGIWLEGGLSRLWVHRHEPDYGEAVFLGHLAQGWWR